MAGHETVLKDEAVDALVTSPDGTYVDCTYGRGGHSKMILQRLSEHGRLMVIDKDLDAIAHARQEIGSDPRAIIAHGSFAELADLVANQKVAGEELPRLDGVLFDLGISSPQIDEGVRGFSFDRDGPLDMRMDQSQGETAADWLNRADAKDIAAVLWKYGEEKFSRRIAAAIVEARVEKPFETTGELVALIERSVPRKEKHKHPATRSFQAIRIYINRELEDLEQCLADILPLMANGGRLVVISFHSLEDRIVKRFMRDQARGESIPDRLPIRDADIKRSLKLIGKPVKPSEAEVARNRRSRSSIMRVAEKIG